MGLTNADVLQERTSQGWLEGQQPHGSDVKGKRRRLLLTIRQGDSNHGYKSVFETCPLPAEYKQHSLLEPWAGRDTHSSAGEGTIRHEAKQTWCLHNFSILRDCVTGKQMTVGPSLEFAMTKKK